MTAIAAIIALASIFGLTKALTPTKSSETTNLYSYTMSVDSRYYVSLKENDLYLSDYLEEGLVYAPSLIDKLNITFTSGFSGNKSAVITGNYSIEAIVQGYQGSSDNIKVIYERKYPILENTDINDEKSSNISEEVSVDLDVYKEFVNQAELIIKSKPVKEAKIVFSGNYLVDTEYGQIEEPFSYTVKIPLANEMFSISKDDPISIVDSISENTEITVAPQTSLIVITSIGSLAAIFAILFLAFQTRRPNPEEQYVLGFKAINRKYGSRMVKLKKLPYISDDMRVVVSNLESLIKISDERQQFICYCPDRNGMPEDDLIYVPDGNTYYMLFLRVKYEPDDEATTTLEVEDILL